MSTLIFITISNPLCSTEKHGGKCSMSHQNMADLRSISWSRIWSQMVRGPGHRSRELRSSRHRRMNEWGHWGELLWLNVFSDEWARFLWRARIGPFMRWGGVKTGLISHIGQPHTPPLNIFISDVSGLSKSHPCSSLLWGMREGGVWDNLIMSLSNRIFLRSWHGERLSILAKNLLYSKGR